MKTHWILIPHKIWLMRKVFGGSVSAVPYMYVELLDLLYIRKTTNQCKNLHIEKERYLLNFFDSCTNIANFASFHIIDLKVLSNEKKGGSCLVSIV